MVTSAVSAPLRSIIALVARVVPWMRSPTAPGSTPERASTSSTPVSTASSGASGVVSTLAVVRASPCSSTTSVKVPPTSTPIRARAREFLFFCSFFIFLYLSCAISVPVPDYFAVSIPHADGLQIRSLRPPLCLAAPPEFNKRANAPPRRGIVRPTGELGVRGGPKISRGSRSLPALVRPATTCRNDCTNTAVPAIRFPTPVRHPHDRPLRPVGNIWRDGLI